jgi:ABC-type multidrug transport system ATPase subunit/predicted DsbA family dithiol-disulfide isomerase
LNNYEALVAEERNARIDQVQIHIPPGPRLGDTVIETEDLRKGFGDRLLIEDLSFSLPPAGIVGVIGPNGAGKTTLFRMIVGQEQPDAGSLRLGETVQLAYVDQSRDALDGAKTVWEEISEGYEHIKVGTGGQLPPVRRQLQLPRLDQQKKVGNLSGGERNRLHMAKLLRTGGNVLLLDEPTNDLDVDTLRALEEALLAFPGCAVIISHDRWFLDRVATHVLAFEGDSQVTWFEGNFEAYEEHRRERLGAEADRPAPDHLQEARALLTGAVVRIRHFTDPGCPWAFSAEPRLLRLAWLYGEQLSWNLKMVVLARTRADEADKGMDPAKQAKGHRNLLEQFGMPFDPTERPHVGATVDACRVVIAARLHAPEREAALLRRVRVLFMGGGVVDDPALLRRASSEAGLEPGAVERWSRTPEVGAALEADLAASRDPSPAARALDHKLAGPAEERRYSCPSLEMEASGGARLDLPGFQPLEAYEAALANLAPTMKRRADPETVTEVLDWAAMPLATVEVAMVMGLDVVEARVALARSGAAFDPVGSDGYWRG